MTDPAPKGAPATSSRSPNPALRGPLPDPSKQMPLFVARQTYRHRRMADAARLLPIFGMVLFLLPSLWVPGNEQGATVRGVIYLFVVWALLIALAALISRRLGPEEPTAEDLAPDTAQVPAPGISPGSGLSGD